MPGKARLTLIILIVLILVFTVVLILSASPLKHLLFKSKSAPQLALELIQGPLYYPEEEHFVFTVEAHVSGNPQPEIIFSRDDSMGTLGPSQALIYLSDGETFNLMVEATNSLGKTSESIDLVARLSDNIELAANEDSENVSASEPEQESANQSTQQTEPGKREEPDQQQNQGNGSEPGQQPDPGNGQEPGQSPDVPADNGDQSEEGRSWENFPHLPELKEPLSVPKVYRVIEGSRLWGTHLGQATQRNPELEITTEDFTILSSEQKLHIWLSLEYDNQPGHVSVALQYYDDICCFQHVTVWVQNFFLKASDIEERRYELIFPEEYGFERDVIPPGDYRFTLYLENASASVHMEHKVPFIF